MSSAENVYLSGASRTHLRVAWLLLAGLLFLRFPFLAGLASFSKSRPDWLDPIFQVGTYLLTACLIWWERERLADFHIDTLAIVIIILFKPIQTLILALWGFQQMALAFPQPLSLTVWVIAIALVVVLRRSHTQFPKIQKTNLRWFTIGVLAGIATALLLGYPMSLQIDKSELAGRPDLWPMLVMAILSFVYQLGYAAVTEEPLFRGFLWGYLRKLKWPEWWIWLFQAGLFMLGHIYYVTTAPISFWIIVPTGGLVLGWLAWRSRSIATSMAAHGAMNALGYTVGYIIAYSRL
jgi:membrane protease YdiL (CAAX protease family)